MKALWNVIRNEWMKFVRRRRLAVVIALALCLVGLYGLGEYHVKQNASRYNPVVAQQQALAELQADSGKSVLREPPSPERTKHLASLDIAIAGVQNQLADAKVAQASAQDWRWRWRRR